MSLEADVGCTEDMGFKPAQRQAAEAILKAREGKGGFVDYEFKDWKGAFALNAPGVALCLPLVNRLRTWLCHPTKLGVP